MNIEKREIAWKGLTLRSADDEGTTSVEGVAVPFGDIIDKHMAVHYSYHPDWAHID